MRIERTEILHSIATEAARQAEYYERRHPDTAAVWWDIHDLASDARRRIKALNIEILERACITPIKGGEQDEQVYKCFTGGGLH